MKGPAQNMAQFFRLFRRFCGGKSIPTRKLLFYRIIHDQVLFIDDKESKTYLLQKKIKKKQNNDTRGIS